MRPISKYLIDAAIAALPLMAFAQGALPAPSDVKALPKDAKKTSSGLAYKVLTPGTGKTHPKDTSQVTVNYAGWTTDGKNFDNSQMHGGPATFPLNRVIKGWT